MMRDLRYSRRRLTGKVMQFYGDFRQIPPDIETGHVRRLIMHALNVSALQPFSNIVK